MKRFVLVPAALALLNIASFGHTPSGSADSDNGVHFQRIAQDDRADRRDRKYERKRERREEQRERKRHRRHKKHHREI
jgi:hypothetical protein